MRGTAASQAPEKVTAQGGTQEQGVAKDKRMAAADVMSGDRRSSMLTGKGVYNEQGALFGEVKDLVIDPMSGRVTHAIVATGGSVTGGAQSLAAVPWDAVKSAMHQGRIVMDQKRLGAAPSFAAGQWPDLHSDGWSREADQYWKNQAGASRQ